jgi:hypothetical protein
MNKKRDLVTGMAGSIVRDYLGNDYDLTGLDRGAVDDVPTPGRAWQTSWP